MDKLSQRGCYLFAALQVTFLGDAPVSSSDANDLMEWKEVSRRVLLQRSGKQGSAQQHKTLFLHVLRACAAFVFSMGP